MKTKTQERPKTWVFSAPHSKVQKKALSPLMFVLSLALLSSCMDYSMDVIEDIHSEYDNIKVINVDAAFLKAHYVGDESITSVTLDALLKSNRENSHQIKYRVEGETLNVEVTSRGLGRIGNLRTDGHIYLTGPKSMELNLSAASGSVKAENVAGEALSLEVGSGKVYAKDIKVSKIYLQASSGNVDAINLEGTIHSNVSSGKIDIHTVKGEVDAEASSGKISLNSIQGLVIAKVNSGSIHLSNVSEIGPLKVSSGRILALNCGLGPYTTLHANSGRIEIQTPSNLRNFNYNLSAGSGRVRVGERQNSGNLLIDNGAPHTVTGTVTSGQISILDR
ncbi:DUF4097 family beta strand repeat-containing protein [Pleomorphovibrio marinus]|uniref:DUF4097 family beta strand repeat-containing protein n=1 Tax=Pleomorphovibrio marinus TaxID=2164132 RepID=UPI000E0BD022|nr:DUF4097 family beta strand repeat-containing protein [Pleomorphovibrio marinus]